MAESIDRIGVYSLGANLALSGLKLGLAAVSGSLALAADGVHSLVDVTGSVAVLIGLRLSRRKSLRYPYGLYKAENVVEVVVALLIFIAAYEIVREALAPRATPSLLVSPYLLLGVGLAVAVRFFFSRYEPHVGHATNSPSLLADARHFETDVLSSAVVLVAIAASYLHLAIDRYAALVVAGFIVWAGWDLLADGMRVLLDASLEPELLDRARAILAASPAVAAVESVTGRNSGRFRFLETEITLRTRDLEKAHRASEQLEGELRQRIPNLDRVLIHYEPAERTVLRLAVPLLDLGGSVSPHFGEAPYFALVDLSLIKGGVVQQEIVANPYASLVKGRGLRVAEWLVAHKVDRVVSAEDLHDRAPGYVLANADVAQSPATATHLVDIVAHELARPSQPC